MSKDLRLLREMGLSRINRFCHESLLQTGWGMWPEVFIGEELPSPGSQRQECQGTYRSHRGARAVGVWGASASALGFTVKELSVLLSFSF